MEKYTEIQLTKKMDFNNRKMENNFQPFHNYFFITIFNSIMAGIHQLITPARKLGYNNTTTNSIIKAIIQLRRRKRRKKNRSMEAE